MLIGQYLKNNILHSLLLQIQPDQIVHNSLTLADYGLLGFFVSLLISVIIYLEKQRKDNLKVIRELERGFRHDQSETNAELRLIVKNAVKVFDDINENILLIKEIARHEK